MDPYERGDVGPTNGFYKFETDNAYLVADGTRRAAEFLHSFIEYPPSQMPASFTIDQAVQQLKMQLQKEKQGK